MTVIPRRIPPLKKTWPTPLLRVLGVQTTFQAHKALFGYLFLSPWFIGLIIFYIGPIIASFYFSLNEYDIISKPRWVGFGNYERAFFKDDLFWPSLGRTLTYSVISVPLGLIGSLLLAILLNQGLKLTNIYRTFYFLPHLTPAVAMSILWVWILHPQNGPVNLFLKSIGIKGPGWFTSEKWAMPSLILVSLWNGIGGNRMLIFLAGLQGVPEELHDAASIDGAGAVSRFWHVTVPMISPTIFFNLVLGVIGALKVFTMAFVTTGGGPSYATWFYALHLYRNAFEYFRMGYSSALAWFLALILFIFTFIQVQTSKHWVYYAGEAR
ncbi:MAG: sugar ABC transporter permease [Chloroflexi bacterium]|nr:sugar ABC transporter permease [Chloroflexota bacterium]